VTYETTKCTVLTWVSALKVKAGRGFAGHLALRYSVCLECSYGGTAHEKPTGKLEKFRT